MTHRADRYVVVVAVLLILVVVSALVMQCGSIHEPRCARHCRERGYDGWQIEPFSHKCRCFTEKPS